MEPVNGDVDNQDAIEVDQPMSDRLFLVVGFEEYLTPWILSNFMNLWDGGRPTRGV